LLLIAYTFPPEVAIGSLRPWGLYRYLHNHGWDTVVLTASPGDALPNVVRVPHQGVSERVRILSGATPNAIGPLANAIRHIRNRIAEVFAYPDLESGWRKPAVSAALAMIARGRFDAILSTSLPATAHVVARDLKSRTGLPWVADFRDLWSENYDYRWGRLRKTLDRQIERTVLAHSQALVTVSEPLAVALKRLHSRPVTVIPNGFSPDEVSEPNHRLTRKFTLTYTGTLYAGKQDPSPLFEALSALIASGRIDAELLEVRFFGRNVDQPWLRAKVAACGLDRSVTLSGMVPRAESLERQRESQVLLALDWMDEQQPGVYSGKIFEYLAALRPILCIGHTGSVVEALLNETGAGRSLNETEPLHCFLMVCYREFVETGRVGYFGRIDAVRRYDHASMAGRFAAVLGQNALP